MSFLISAAHAQEAAAPAAAPGNEMMSLLMLVGFMVIFYFMIWRPQAKRAKEHKNLLASLQKGDEVITSGGIAGRVSKVADDFVVVEVSDTVELKIQKGAIVASLPKGTLKAI
ncbi:preprotein translocase subunit YajC [Azomonas agilis]|uniref:Sec translocon accessory complex subunit YajC n=1 Tax=Azomonas agilis TaxID=116849 RepID=A0A562IZX1_9GAMM|nr:preprotein translocase subunit YajC [Azomonas agilis]TWH76452.1 preprotein translocase subunit YajC [Azomonas agilis]